MAKSWTGRMHAPAEIVVKPAPVDIAGMRAGQVMLVPTTRLIADFMAAVPPGGSVSVVEMRAELARRFAAEVTCPIYTVAEAALEAHAAGMPVEAITPFWRVLDEGSPTTGRLPDGVAFVRARRAAEQSAG